MTDDGSRKLEAGSSGFEFLVNHKSEIKNNKNVSFDE